MSNAQVLGILSLVGIDGFCAVMAYIERHYSAAGVGFGFKIGCVVCTSILAVWLIVFLLSLIFGF